MIEIERQEVDSSNILSIGYDESEKMLDIEFATGAVYRYFEVEKEKYKELIKADSIGAHVNLEISKNYSYEQVE